MAPLVWLVTGTSSGLGEAFIHSIIARGDKAIATARSLAKIQHLKTAGADILQLDVTAPQAELDAIIKTAIGIHGHLDVLVNNAGYGQIGTFEEVSQADLQATLNTNLFGSINVTRAALPHFRANHAGTIVFISSIGAWIGVPGLSAYSASKFALSGMVESLQQEIAPLGIKTLLVEPSSLRTAARSPESRRLAANKFKDYESLMKNVVQAFDTNHGERVSDTRKTADIVVNAVKGDGPFKGKEVPFRLVLGADALDWMRNKVGNILASCEEWDELFKSNNIEVANE